MKSKLAFAIAMILLTSVQITPSLADANQKNIAVSFNKTVPAFPKAVKNYRLLGTAPIERVRIFEGDDWIVPISEFNPEKDNGATMSCQPYFWAMRWRTPSPNVTVLISKGLTDGGEYGQVSKSISASAGYVSDYSCLVPGVKFGKDLKKTGANLVDMNIEYQIWEYKPKI